jgi:hypothetical protein
LFSFVQFQQNRAIVLTAAAGHKPFFPLLSRAAAVLALNPKIGPM